MNDNSIVCEWLKGNLSYDEGVAFFMRNSNNVNLKKKLIGGESKTNRDILDTEIKAIAKKSGFDVFMYMLKLKHFPKEMKVSEKRNPIVSAPIEVAKPQATSVKSYDETVKLLYRERGHYHGQLHSASSDPERLAIMLKLSEIQSKLNRYFKGETDMMEGKVANEITKKHLSGEEVIRMRNLKQYIGYYEKKIARDPENELLDTWHEKIKEFEVELKSLRNAK